MSPRRAWISLLLLIGLIVPLSVYAQGNLYLMIGADLNIESTYYSYGVSKNRTPYPGIEHMFKSRFAQFPLTVKPIVDQATADDLARALQDDDTVGIFWIGHGAGGLQSNGLLFGSYMPDSLEQDVSELWALARPNLRLMSLISCTAKNILDRLEARGAFNSNPGLFKWASSDIVDLEIGTNRATAQSYVALAYSLRQYPEKIPPPDKQKQFVFEIQRTNQSANAIGPIVIISSGRAIGYLPSLKAHGQQTVQASLSHLDYFQGRNLYLEVRRLRIKAPNPQEDFGEIQISAPNLGVTLKAILGEDGRPRGSSFRLYQLDSRQPRRDR